MRLELQRIYLMSVQNSILIGEVFQIEVSDGLVHRLGSYQNINLYPARVFSGTRVLRSCMRLEILMMKYFKSRFQMVFFCQNVMGARVLGSLYVFRVPKGHSNGCIRFFF